MVLESLINPLKAEKKPWEMIFIGILYSSVALFISINLFQDIAGLIAVFLVVVASVPIIYNTIKLEEKKDDLGLSELTLLKEHSKALMVFICLFFGVMIAFTMWYVFLPSDSVSVAFSIQLDTIKGINEIPVSGNAYQSAAVLFMIFTNNLKVMMFCILFAFFFGAGAAFILTWNASVVAVAIGSLLRRKLEGISHYAGFHAFGNYLHVISFSFLRYMIHGIPEMIAYFIAGLAGGIISVAVIRHDFRSSNFKRVVFDSIDLILIAVVVLLLAALIEVFITPVLF